MKVVLIICLVGFMTACHGQAKKETAKNQTVAKVEKSDSSKQLNLLDEQTKIFGQVFELSGLSKEENPTGGANNYLDMIDKMEASDELKEQIREIYHLYDTSLDPTKKAELKIKVTQMLENAKAQTSSEQ